MSFIPGVRSASLSQIAIATAILIFVPLTSGQLKASTPTPKAGASGMLPAAPSSPTATPKLSSNTAAVTSATQAAAVTLTAYNADGTNTGTARLGHNVTVDASIAGQANASFTWSVTGAGTITSAGVYTAPAAMPASGAVTITATLASNATVTGSYSLNLIYSAPTIRWVNPSTLISGESNSILVSGNDFTPATTITVGGVSVPGTFNGSNGVLAQIPVTAGVTAPVSIVATNPTPGGGRSVAVSAPVQAPTMTLNAFSSDGENTGTARLGRSVTIDPVVVGLANPSVTWSVQGAGSITSAGKYTAPAAMPSSTAVTVTATLTSNTTVTAAYSFQLMYSAPTIVWVNPAILLSGETNSVLVSGNDFTPATTITVGGKSVSGVFNGTNGVLAQIPIATGVTSAVSIVASNPAPGGGSSVAVSASVQSPAFTLTAYSVDGTNTGTARLGRNVTVDANLAGQAASPAVTWSVKGAGTITAAGVYTAPYTMPSSGSVTITATLVSNTAVSASYTLQLIYSAPNLQWVVPASLLSGQTNSVQFSGVDFTPATTITVNGSPVAGIWLAPNAVVAQIPVAAGSMTAVSVVASNPTPGGGSSAAVSVPVKPLTIALSSYSTTAANPTSAPLGASIQFVALVNGGNSAISWPITWSVQGGGSISSAGLYSTPTQMPSSPTVIVTATLASNTSVTATTSFSLLDPTPIVNRSQPVQATAGATSTFTFFGENFNSRTMIEVNGKPVTTTFLSSTSVSAPVATAQGAIGSLSITAVNPAPNGGQSGIFELSIGDTNAVWATIGSTPGLAIAGDFVGFSHEWGMQSLMGSAKTGVNNIYRQLVQNLSNPGTPFFIRIGGGSTDSTAEPTTGLVQPFSDLATAMPVKFSLGVNLANNNLQLSEDQTSYFVSHLPTGSIAAIELGNEPDNYPNAGLRPSTYDFTGYFADVTKWDAGLSPLLPQGVKLIGPSFTTVWHLQENMPLLEQDVASDMSILSAHYYAGYTSGLPQDYLLEDSTVTKDIASFGYIASLAHTNGQLFRIDETNTVDGGGLLGMSNTFSAALWAADVMFAEASAGVDGVNWHGNSGCAYCAFTFGVQTAANGMNSFQLEQVNPLYYGLLFFHEATANSAKLLPVTVSTSGPANVKVWATVDAAGTVHVAILNKDEDFTGNVTVTVRGYGPATAIRMVAPNFLSTAGISIGGQTFDNSFDGNPIGSPMSESFAPINSQYTIPVQAMSAVLLTLTK